VNDDERARAPGATFGQRYVLAQRLIQALGASVRSSIGAQHFGPDGRLKSPAHALIADVDESPLPTGPGRLEAVRLRQAHGAAALVLNSFGRWRQHPHLLPLAGESGFRELRFDARCPTGLRGTPPLLELIAGHDGVIVAVTARCAEYLSTRPRKLTSAYAQLRPPASLSPWFDLLPSLRADPPFFRYVDAAGLLKLAVGLGRTFPDRPAKLVYLFWEPTNAQAFPAFAEHRAELACLTARVAASSVVLVAQSFEDLWSEWQALAEPDWLRGMVARLRARYSVAIAEPSGL
jgi:hypothetical protein